MAAPAPAPATPSRSYLFLAGTLVLAAVFGRLGWWQLDRLRERQAEIRIAREARALPPLSLDDPGQAAAAAGTLDNRRVVVSGRYDHAAELVLRGQTEGGVPGVRIVTPLRPLGADTAWLVQRGFVPSPDARTVELEPLQERGVQVVRGLALVLPDSEPAASPREEQGRLTWRRVDLGWVRAQLPYPVAPYLVLQSPDSGLPRVPRRDDPPVLDAGPHLSYALQWFGFGVTAVVVGLIVGLRRR